MHDRAPPDRMQLANQHRLWHAVWEALMGEPAYQGISKMQVMFGVVSEGLRPVFPPNTPPWYAQIAEVCWRREPKRRYTPGYVQCVP